MVKLEYNVIEPGNITTQALKMVVWILTLALCYMFDQLYFVNGFPLSTNGPIDRVIQMQLLQFTNGHSLVDGLVLAGTIVEGGPVYDRSRKILGGRSVHPGLDILSLDFRVDRCPPVTFGYQCLDRVPPHCGVTRHLMFRSKVCTCRVNVCL